MNEAKQERDIDTVSSSELDALVAENVMGWIHNPPNARCADCWLLPNGEIEGRPFPFSTDERYVAQVETKIERYGLTDLYIEKLLSTTQSEKDGKIECYPNWWLAITATPEQRCRAILKALLP